MLVMYNSWCYHCQDRTRRITSEMQLINNIHVDYYSYRAFGGQNKIVYYYYIIIAQSITIALCFAKVR